MLSISTHPHNTGPPHTMPGMGKASLDAIHKGQPREATVHKWMRSPDTLPWPQTHWIREAAWSIPRTSTLGLGQATTCPNSGHQRGVSVKRTIQHKSLESADRGTSWLHFRVHTDLNKPITGRQPLTLALAPGHTSCKNGRATTGRGNMFLFLWFTCCVDQPDT